MSEKKRRRAAFISDHPFCCLCGGDIATETIEHAPPKVMFWDKQRAKGLEVPACKRCNHGSSQSDQLAAFYAIAQSPQFYGDSDNAERTKYFSKLGRGCKHNVTGFTTFFEDAGTLNIFVNGTLTKQHKLTFKDELFDKHLNPWSVKQALAHWYDTHGTIFSEDGIIIIRWLTNYELLKNTDLEPFISRFGNVSNLYQGIKNNNDQFYIRYPETEFEDNIHLMFAAYHGTAFIAALIDNQEVLSRLGPNPLGDSSAIYKTSSVNGIYASAD